MGSDHSQTGKNDYVAKKKNITRGVKKSEDRLHSYLRLYNYGCKTPETHIAHTHKCMKKHFFKYAF